MKNKRHSVYLLFNADGTVAPSLTENPSAFLSLQLGDGVGYPWDIYGVLSLSENLRVGVSGRNLMMKRLKQGFLGIFKEDSQGRDVGFFQSLGEENEERSFVLIALSGGLTFDGNTGWYLLSWVGASRDAAMTHAKTWLKKELVCFEPKEIDKAVHKAIGLRMEAEKAKMG